MTPIAYLLDTNICIALMKGNPITLQHLAKTSPTQVYVCPIVTAELYFGVYQSQYISQNLINLEIFLNTFNMLPITKAVSQYYGQIRADLTKQGNLIGPNDLIIAATALAHKVTLVTNNSREFSRITSLVLVDWTKP